MDTCPTCERTAKRLDDYPLVQVLDYRRCEIPEYIGGRGQELVPTTIVRGHLFWKRIVDNPAIPTEVFRELRVEKKNIAAAGGNVYRRFDGFDESYQRSRDITAEMQAALRGELVQQVFSTLEEVVGKDLSTKEFVKRLGIGQKFTVGDSDDVSVEFEDDFYQSDDNLPRSGRVTIAGGWIGDFYHMRMASLSRNLATLRYVGKFKV